MNIGVVSHQGETPRVFFVHYLSTNVKRINDGCRELTGRGREGIIHSTVATHF